MEIKNSWLRYADCKVKTNRLDRRVIRAMLEEADDRERETDDTPPYTLFYKLGRVAFSRNGRVVYLRESELLRLADELDDFAERSPDPDITELEDASRAEVSKAVDRAALGKYAVGLAAEIDQYRVAAMSPEEFSAEMNRIIRNHSSGS